MLRCNKNFLFPRLSETELHPTGRYSHRKKGIIWMEGDAKSWAVTSWPATPSQHAAQAPHTASEEQGELEKQD